MYRLRNLLQICFLHSCHPSNPNAVTNVFPGLKTETEDALVEEKLPEEVGKKVISLRCKSSARSGVCNVVLVGIRHSSKKSSDLTQAVISFWKPEVVFLELCREREGVLFSGVLGGALMCVWEWLCPIVAREQKVIRGNEFRVAFIEATKYGGEVILGDRPQQITLRRLWDKMSLSELSGSSFRNLNIRLIKMVEGDGDVDVDEINSVIQQMSQVIPNIMEVLVHERDKYMSTELLRVASKHNSVVAVVGLAHLPGIKKNWEQSIQAMELLDTPVQKPAIPEAKIIT